MPHFVSITVLGVILPPRVIAVQGGLNCSPSSDYDLVHGMSFAPFSILPDATFGSHVDQLRYDSKLFTFMSSALVNSSNAPAFPSLPTNVSDRQVSVKKKDKDKDKDSTVSRLKRNIQETFQEVIAKMKEKEPEKSKDVGSGPVESSVDPKSVSSGDSVPPRISPSRASDFVNCGSYSSAAAPVRKRLQRVVQDGRYAEYEELSARGQFIFASIALVREAREAGRRGDGLGLGFGLDGGIGLGVRFPRHHVDPTAAATTRQLQSQWEEFEYYQSHFSLSPAVVLLFTSHRMLCINTTSNRVAQESVLSPRSQPFLSFPSSPSGVACSSMTRNTSLPSVSDERWVRPISSPSSENGTLYTRPVDQPSAPAHHSLHSVADPNDEDGSQRTGHRPERSLFGAVFDRGPHIKGTIGRIYSTLQTFVGGGAVVADDTSAGLLTPPMFETASLSAPSLQATELKIDSSKSQSEPANEEADTAPIRRNVPTGLSSVTSSPVNNEYSKVWAVRFDDLLGVSVSYPYTDKATHNAPAGNHFSLSLKDSKELVLHLNPESVCDAAQDDLDRSPHSASLAEEMSVGVHSDPADWTRRVGISQLDPSDFELLIATLYECARRAAEQSKRISPFIVSAVERAALHAHRTGSGAVTPHSSPKENSVLVEDEQCWETLPQVVSVILHMSHLPVTQPSPVSRCCLFLFIFFLGLAQALRGDDLWFASSHFATFRGVHLISPASFFPHPFQTASGIRLIYF